MEVVQDFFKSPTLEKFKNIPISQRRSLLAEYLKVCGVRKKLFCKLCRVSQSSLLLRMFRSRTTRAYDKLCQINGINQSDLRQNVFRPTSVFSALDIGTGFMILRS